MKILVIDTSSERGVVALLEGTASNIQLKGTRFFGQQANPLMSEMEQLFAELKWVLNDLDVIGVGIGPGSYTGIRVGSMVAKTLSFAKKIPLIGVPSLFGWVPENVGSFAVVVDAKVGGLYLLIGKVQEDGSVVTDESAVYPLQEAILKLEKVSSLYTPHANLIQKRFSSLENSIDVTKWQWHDSSPSPKRLAQYALQRFEQGLFSTEGEINLLYLRKTQAEIERENR